MNKYIPQTKQSWTQLDAIALLNGISTWDKDYMSLSYVRLPGETQVDIRNKISRVHENPTTDTSLQSLMNGLSAELNLESSIVKTRNYFELTNFPVKRGIGFGPNDSDINIWKLDNVEHPELSESWSPWQTFTDNVTPRDDLKIYDYDDEFWNKNIIVSELLSSTPIYIKFEYWIKQYDEQNNPIFKRFTDMSSNITINNDLYLDPWVFLPCTQPFTSLGSIEFNKLAIYSFNDLELMSYGPGFYAPKMFWFITIPTGQVVATANTYNIYDQLSSGDPTYNDVSDYSTMWDINNDQLCVYDESQHIHHLFTNAPLYEELTGGVESNSKSLMVVDMVEDEDLNWNLKCRSGSFYIAGKTYYLMNNPKLDQVTSKAIEINFIDGIGSIPSYVYTKSLPTREIDYRHKKFVLLKEDYDITANFNIVPDYNYPIIENNSSSNGDQITIYFEDQKALRYSTLPSDDGYYIDFDEHKIILHNPDTVPNTLYFILDDIDVPTDVLLKYNINPVTNDNIQHISYIVSLFDTE